MDTELIGQTYGLTSAELRVLGGLIRGQKTDEIALSIGRSRETVRSQLKSLYSKTGSSGRVDLMRLLVGPLL